MNRSDKTPKRADWLRRQIDPPITTQDASGYREADLMAGRIVQQSVLDGIADPIMVIDREFRVHLMNRAAREFSAGDATLSLPVFCYEISHQRDTPCDGEEHPCPLEEVCKTRQPVKVLHEHYTANGEKRLLEIIATPLWGPDHSIQGVVESMRDVTERMRAEQELKDQADRIRALAAQFTEVTEAERQRLARELHDLVGQNLSALAINLNIIQTQLDKEAADLVGTRIEDSLALVDETTDQIRDLMARLRPPILDDCGLVAALLWYGQKFTRWTGIPVHVECDDPETRLSPRVENAIFRIAQEALTNVARHARATTVTVHVEVDDGRSRFVIADDGIGFTPVPVLELDEGRGWGLLTMNERAEAVGGQCRVESAPRRGTRVIVEIPR